MWGSPPLGEARPGCGLSGWRSVSRGKAPTMFLQPAAGSPVESIDPGVLVSAVGGVVLLSLMGAAVRSRPVAALCRLGALVCAMYPVTVAWSAWKVNDP